MGQIDQIGNISLDLIKTCPMTMVKWTPAVHNGAGQFKRI